jgi:hypothetical protein
VGEARPRRSHEGPDRLDDRRARGTRASAERESRAPDRARNFESLHTRGNRLPHINASRNHHAIDRSGDDCQAKIDLGLIERGFRLRDLRFCSVQAGLRHFRVGFGGLEIRHRDKLATSEIARPCQFCQGVFKLDARPFGICPQTDECGLRLLNLGFK